MKCHHCNNELEHVFLDLGFAPPSNSYLTAEQLRQSEKTYPLKLLVCSTCWLVQTEDNESGEQLFHDDYAYFSSVSKMLLDHAKRYCDMITERLGLSEDSYVIEVASNDGYLLRNFVESGVPCLGIETTAGTGNIIGSTFEELAAVIGAARHRDRLGVCFDTCHAFAAGYDIRAKRAYAGTMRRFDETIGLGLLRAFHLNDSRTPLGSRRDRHAHIGQGEICERGFTNLMRDKRFDDRPMILETPKGPDLAEDVANLALLRRLRGRR